MDSHSKKSGKNPLQFFTSISQNTIPPKVWFTILSLPSQPSSYSIQIILPTLDYLQLIIQAILANQNLYNSASTTPEVVKTLFSLCKTLNPGSFMPIQQDNEAFALGVFLFLTCYTLLKFGLLAYVITLCIKRSYGSKYLVMIWRWIFRLQAPVIYLLVTSIWSNYFRAGYQNKLGLESGYNIALMGFSGAMVLLELIFSLVLTTQFAYSIPNKSIMAAKNGYIEALSLIQKFMIQLFRNIFIFQIPKGVLVSVIFSFFLCMIRNLYYFTCFPHYRLKAVLYHSSFLVTVACMYVTYLLHIVLKNVYNEQLNPSFGLMLWIILTPPLVILHRKYVKIVWSNLIIRNEIANKNMVIHKIIAMKHIIKFLGTPPKSAKKYPYSYLLSRTALAQIDAFLNEGLSEDSQDFNPKENIKKYIMKYLQELLINYQNDDLIRLYIASYYAQKLTLYGPAMRLLQDLKHSSNFNIALTAHMIIFDLQETLKNEFKRKQNKLDLATYIENMSRLSQLKEEIFKQAGFQVGIYENLVKSPQDLGQIFRLAQKVNNQRNIVEKKIQYLLEMTPEYFLEPLVVCAHYYFVINHAPHQYYNYAKMYNQRFAKYERIFLSKKLCQENIHHKGTQLVVFSGNKKDSGIIRFISKSYQDNFGKSLIGHHVCMGSKASLRDVTYKWFNFISEKGVKSDHDTEADGFQYNFKEECIRPCVYYSNLNPFLCEGLFYISLTRFSKRNDEFLVIQDNGNIICFTKIIGLKLGLFEKRKSLTGNVKMNIEMISEDLAKANDAINMISCPGKFEESSVWKLDVEEAQGLHSNFTTEGGELILRSLKESKIGNKKTFVYNCKFQTRVYGGDRVRVIALQRPQNFQEKSEDLRESLASEDPDLEFLDNEENSEPEGIIPSEHNRKIILGKDQNKQQSDLLITKRTTSTNSKNMEHNRLPLSKGNHHFIYTDQENLSTSRKLLTTGRNFGEHFSLTGQSSSKEPNQENLGNKTEGPEGRSYDLVPYGNDKRTYCSSPTEKQKVCNVSKDFHNAISSKYYPNSFKILTLILYLFFMGIFAIQIAFKDSFERDVQIFQARKEVASLCISRTDLFIAAYGQARSVWIFAVGQQNQSNYPVYLQAPTLLVRMRTFLSQLSHANKDMLTAMNALDVESRERLFEKNVRIYDARSNQTGRGFINLTTFQAVDKLVETGLRGIHRGTHNLYDVIPDFEILLINALNDLLIESETLASFLVGLVNQQRDLILNRNLGTLINCYVILILLVIAFSAVIVKQYKNERQNMLAITRLDTGGIKKIREKVIAFQAKLQDETGFEQLENFDHYIPLHTNIAIKSKGKAKQNIDFHKPNFKGISRTYKWHFLALVTLLIVTTVLITGKFCITASLTNSLSYVLNQIYFNHRAIPKLRLASIITIDLVSDNTSLIRNLPLWTEFSQELDYLRNVTHNITDTLKSKDQTYDPIIQGILFENGCDYVSNSDFFRTQCQIMRKNSSKAGLVRFLTDFQSTMLDFETRYKGSDGSLGSLMNISSQTYVARIPSMLVFNDLMARISNQLDSSFSQTIVKTKAFSNRYSLMLYFCLLIICWLIQVRVINRIKEAENEFKNVLKVFPAKIILSNFILKSYLIRTWKGTLDSARLLGRD